MRALPPDEKTSHIARTGLKRVKLDRAVRLIRDRIRWIKYQTADVLDPMTLQDGIVAETHDPDPKEPVKETRAASDTLPLRSDL